MALEIQRNQRHAVAVVSDRMLYLTNDKSQVVEEGDVRAGFLFATPGWEISAADAARYRLTSVDGVVVIDAPEQPAVPAASEVSAPTPEPEPPVAPKPPEPTAPAEPARPAPAAGRSKKGRSGGS